MDASYNLSAQDIKAYLAWYPLIWRICESQETSGEAEKEKVF
jgi:hypothetical protein